MDDRVLRSLTESLLELLEEFLGILGFAVLQERLEMAVEGFEVGLHAGIAGRAALVLAQIFDGCVFIRHREWSKYTEAWGMRQVRECCVDRRERAR